MENSVEKIILNEEVKGNSLVIKWLGLHSSTATDTASIPAGAMGHGFGPWSGNRGPICNVAGGAGGKGTKNMWEEALVLDLSFFRNYLHFIF